MATIRHEIFLSAAPDHVWEAVRDFGAVHTRLAVGFVVDCKRDGAARLVTFANGMTAREELVSIEEERRRLVYAVIGGRATHYNASVEVLPEGAGSRFIWTIDLLPNELAGPIGAMAAQGAQAIERTLGAVR